jgi:hypothetical protein
MSRPECHLHLRLAPAECGLLLSRVHNAEQLEEFSLVIVGEMRDERSCQDEQVVDEQAVESALSKCRSRKLRISVINVIQNLSHFPFLDVPSSQWYPLCGALLRGIATNCNDVDFALLILCFNVDRIMSQLPQQCWERFEVGKRRNWTYIKLKPHTPTGSVQRSLTSEESTSEVEASPVPVSAVPQDQSRPWCLLL